VPRPLTPRQAAVAALPALALALAVLGAGCTEDPPRCPGRSEGAFLLQATRTAVTCASGAPATAQGLDDLYPRGFTATVTVSFAADGAGAAICTLRRTSEPLTGTRQGDQVSVALETGGAVLEACAATCAVTMRQEITGTLARDAGSGLATGFSGTLVDTATAAAGVDCAPCTPPCSATYALAPAPGAP
jgi:hypothetical protein